MKKILILLIDLFLILCCSKNNNSSLIDKVENFKVSECQSNYGIDSIGIRKNKIVDNVLYLKIGHIKNCAWEDGFLKSIKYKNDTLLIGLDRPFDIDTLMTDTAMVKGKQIINMSIEHTYPLYDCDCFFYFELSINEFTKIPKTVRLFEGEGINSYDYWDKTQKTSYEVEDIQIDF